jgi:hypothetical protein
MENCEHKEIENIDSKYTVDNCNLITQQCKKCKMKKYVHKGKNIYNSSKWFKLK